MSTPTTALIYSPTPIRHFLISPRNANPLSQPSYPPPARPQRDSSRESRSQFAERRDRRRKEMGRRLRTRRLRKWHLAWAETRSPSEKRVEETRRLAWSEGCNVPPDLLVSPRKKIPLKRRRSRDAEPDSFDPAAIRPPLVRRRISMTDHALRHNYEYLLAIERIAQQYSVQPEFIAALHHLTIGFDQHAIEIFRQLSSTRPFPLETYHVLLRDWRDATNERRDRMASQMLYDYSQPTRSQSLMPRPRHHSHRYRPYLKSRPRKLDPSRHVDTYKVESAMGDRAPPYKLIAHDGSHLSSHLDGTSDFNHGDGLLSALPAVGESTASSDVTTPVQSCSRGENSFQHTRPIQPSDSDVSFSSRAFGAHPDDISCTPVECGVRPLFESLAECPNMDSEPSDPHRAVSSNDQTNLPETDVVMTSHSSSAKGDTTLVDVSDAASQELCVGSTSALDIKSYVPLVPSLLNQPVEDEPHPRDIVSQAVVSGDRSLLPIPESTFTTGANPELAQDSSATLASTRLSPTPRNPLLAESQSLFDTFTKHMQDALPWYEPDATHKTTALDSFSTLFDVLNSLDDWKIGRRRIALSFRKYSDRSLIIHENGRKEIVCSTRHLPFVPHPPELNEGKVDPGEGVGGGGGGVHRQGQKDRRGTLVKEGDGHANFGEDEDHSEGEDDGNTWEEIREQERRLDEKMKELELLKKRVLHTLQSPILV
ncbi:hypothetical protein JAAARDRAFT_195433 [Jaapia argillacea MUCL 33604]|uniref:Uncharacterized protein n=1 Tax=Jaapia argillacea MUCL 33604 TaxID=933084 RepID=A0A067PWD7_9AGAM|nr:hypothetical protein JAAARDRAFT_195433 [Jaapia argillacea MUCL 33604]